MEKRRLNHSDWEYMKMGMLKHEETFREQVYELHRLYQIQKTLMKDIPKTRQCLNLEQPTEADQVYLPDKYRVSEVDNDQNELELTLGSRSYYQKKIKASEPAACRVPSEHSGEASFSSSSTGSSQEKGATLTGEDQMLSWGISNQDRLSCPPWIFQALSLSIT